MLYFRKNIPLHSYHLERERGREREREIGFRSAKEEAKVLAAAGD